MSTTNIADADLTATLEAIARKYLGVPTLRTRNSNALDFHEVSAAGLRSALAAAYEAGLRAAHDTKSTESPASLRQGALVRWNGATWRVLAVDADPKAQVWIVSVEDPDRDAFVMPAELAPA